MHGATLNRLAANEHEGHYFGDKGEIGSSSATGAAEKASGKAGKSGRPEDHKAAAAAHGEAAKTHADAGNGRMAAMHQASAKYHAKVSGGRTTNVTTMNREQLIESLTKNCKCDEDRAALNQLSEETLRGVWNAAGAAASGGGPGVQAGGKGKDDPPDDGGNYEDDDDGLDTPNVRGKKTPADNMAAWEAAMPPQAQQIWNVAKQVERRERLMVVRRLVANVADPESRKQLGERLMRKSLPELQELALLVPQRRADAPSLNRGEDDDGPSAVSYLGSNAPTGNSGSGGYDKTDILPLPTMNWDEVAKEHERRAN